MSLIIQKRDPFDDSAERAAWQRYCDSKGYWLKYDHAAAKIDGYMATARGISAVELARNACWGAELSYPPQEDVHMPARKLRYFCRMLEGCELSDEDGNWVQVKTGYFVILNTTHTRAAFVEFRTVLEESSKPFIKNLNGEFCEVVTIPHKFLRYVNIPGNE